jgi:hypothetical protein
MYCSSCGTALTDGLSYCSRCGSEVGGKNSPVEVNEIKPPQIPEPLVWATVAVSVGGLAIVVGLIAVMKASGFSYGLITLFSLLSFLLLVGAESVFIWLIVRSKRESAILIESRVHSRKELGGIESAALPEPVPSVTEHTTRTLEPVLRKHKAE